MNPRQAIALALGTVLCVTLVLTPRLYSRPAPVSLQVQPDGSIVDERASHPIFWQPPVFALIVLLTGGIVLRLRTPRE